MQQRMRPTVTTKTDLPPIPTALSSVALIDAPTCAAAGGMSVSWWHEEVRTGRAPAPVVRQPRCTRWRLSQVSEFWQAFASKGSEEAAALVTAKAKKASNAARVKRAATAQRAAI
jgi:predicted DNA-binding transcriptional regulator AlpA